MWGRLGTARTVPIREETAEGADEPIEKRGAALSRELQRQRVRAPHFRLELDVVKGRGEPFEARHRILTKGNTGLLTAHQDALDPQTAAENSQLGGSEKGLRRRRERPKPVTELLAQRLDFSGLGERRQAAIDIELRLLERDVVVGQIGGRVHRHVSRHEPGRTLAPHEPLDGLVEHAKVEIEAHRLHESRLLRAEQVPRSAKLEVLERDAISGAELRVMLEDLKAALGVLVDRVRDEQVAVGAPVRAPDTSAQLVELRQAKMVGAIDEHRVRVRNVEPRFDDHGRDENVQLSSHELAHHLFEVALAHLAVADGDSRAWRKTAHMIGDRLDGVDAVVHEEHLPTAVYLAGDAFFDEAVVPWLDESEHG